MYLLPKARGLGLGKKLIMKTLETAVALGYSRVYLETMAELSAAVQTYTHLGFISLSEPLGNSGHHSCEIWMIKQLD
jgi:putative acetyltransferase